MKILAIGGRQYQLFHIVTIHEDDQYVECRDLATGQLMCEIRISQSGVKSLLPTSVEVDLRLLEEAVLFARKSGDSELH